MTVPLEDEFHKNTLLLQSFTFNMVKHDMQNRSGPKQHTVNIFIFLHKNIKELQKLTLTRVKMGSRVSCFVMTSVKWNLCFFSENKLIYYHVDLCVKKLSHCGLSKSIFFDRDKMLFETENICLFIYPTTWIKSLLLGCIILQIGFRWCLSHNDGKMGDIGFKCPRGMYRYN